MTDKQIEALFERWYDSRKGMPPSSFESYLAGYITAMKKCAVKSRVTL